MSLKIMKVMFSNKVTHGKFYTTTEQIVQMNKKNKIPVFQYVSRKTPKKLLYGWGYADSGALGFWGKKFKNPQRLTFQGAYNVQDIACGFGFTIFSVDDNKKLYGAGINSDSQIGHNLGKSDYIKFVPEPMILTENQNKLKVLQVAAGRAHVIVLTNDGLYTLGNNAYGQCGRQIVIDENYARGCLIHHVRDIDNQKIVGVQTGQDHSLVITEKGQVYSCGWGADGQTGLGHYQNEWKFTRVLGDISGEFITKLACTADCVLALNDKGEIFGWGNSEYGQLSDNSDVQQVNLPVHLKYEIGKIVDIAAGGSFCMALNEKGHIYVWGYGLLGAGHGIYKSCVPVLIPPTFFTNEFQPNAKVTSISCGIGHMAAVTNLGDLYMWGKNRQGCLGLGHLNNQPFPLKVAIGAFVKKVSCGLDHTIAICNSYM